MRVKAQSIFWMILCSLVVPLYAVPPNAEESAIMLMAKGDYFFQSGKIAEALIHYQNALKRDPELVECHYKLGRLFFDQAEYNFAEYHYGQVLKNQRDLTYIHYYLDALFELAYTHYRKAEKVDPGSDRNTYIVQMQNDIDEIIAAFAPRGRFAALENQYVEIEQEYYLARAWYIKARLLWDKNRDQEYPNAFINAYKYFDQFREKQKTAENSGKIAVREAECLYFLYRHHAHLQNGRQANAYRASAMRIRNELISRADELLANPATHFDDDIRHYQQAAESIDSLFSGKTSIEPLFRFFKPKEP